MARPSERRGPQGVRPHDAGPRKTLPDSRLGPRHDAVRNPHLHRAVTEHHGGERAPRFGGPLLANRGHYARSSRGHVRGGHRGGDLARRSGAPEGAADSTHRNGDPRATRRAPRGDLGAPDGPRPRRVNGPARGRAQDRGRRPVDGGRPPDVPGRHAYRSNRATLEPGPPRRLRINPIRPRPMDSTAETEGVASRNHRAWPFAVKSPESALRRMSRPSGLRLVPPAPSPREATQPGKSSFVNKRLRVVTDSARRVSAVAFSDFLQLMKLRIDALLLLVAAAGYVATSRTAVDIPRFGLLMAAGLLGAAGASATNHYLDRDLDAVMRRTRTRPLPQHRIEPPAHALAFGVGLLGLSLAIAGFGLNLLTAAMIGLGYAIYVGVYTIGLKRTHVSNIVIGGLAGSCPALAGSAAAANSIGLTVKFLAHPSPETAWAGYRFSGIYLAAILIGMMADAILRIPL